MKPKKKCQYENCTNIARIDGYCRRHNKELTAKHQLVKRHFVKGEKWYKRYKMRIKRDNNGEI